MRTVDEHRRAVLDGLGPLPATRVPLVEALGLVLAEDVVAAVDLPGFDNSAMDGYAVRAVDVAHAAAGTPVSLPVRGDVAAGSVATGPLVAGTAVRVMTGAPVPPGADAVVPVELTDGGVDVVEVRDAVGPGANVRRQGEELRAGDHVLAAGTALRPSMVALLAGTGEGRPLVHRRPRVLVVATGSELVPPGEPLAPGKLYESDGALLTAMVADAGGIPVRTPIVRDDPQELTNLLTELLGRPGTDIDLVLTSGGVSVGAYDVVKAALAPTGDVTFTTVAMQPGKPQGHGVLGPSRTPVLTFPGNPVSVFVSFQLFGLPVLRRLMGRPDEDRPVLRARLAQSIRSASGRRQFLRGQLSGVGSVPVVAPVGGPGSHLVHALAQADCLIVVPEQTTELVPGDVVDVLLTEEPQW